MVRPKETRYNVNSLAAALAGLRHALTHEVNFQVEAVLAVLALVFGIILGLTHLEWLILVLTIGFVLALELVNTGFEHLADVNTPRFHSGIKIAKDVSAAAVLLASITALAIGVWLFVPRLAALFGIL
ncbi:MAG: diacylglycerol kinase family protein [Parcubacteria group bacterium]